MTSNTTVKFYELPEYHANKAILVYIPPVILCIGTFGNVLSFVVLTRKRMREKSTYLYLATLAAVDLLVIYVGLLLRWAETVTEFNLKETSEFSCRFLTAFGYTITDCSVWLIIAVTVERFIVARYPLRASAMCTRGRAAKVIVAIFLALLGLNSHFFFTSGLRSTNSASPSNGTSPGNQTVVMETVSMRCTSLEGYEQMHKIWQFVDACLYSFIPFLVLCVLNVLIIKSVIVSQREMSKHNETGLAASKHSLQHRGNRRMTIMLLTISCTFLVTTTPMNISLIINTYVNSQLDSDFTTYTPGEHRLIARLILLTGVTKMLMFTNHSINFFLYCATGQAFRKQLVQLFRCDGDSGYNDSLTMSPGTSHTHVVTVNGGRHVSRECKDLLNKTRRQGQKAPRSTQAERDLQERTPLKTA